ncbi:MAG: GNAT family N-acetyltransferase [Flavobacteriia bacterium]
MNEIRTPETEQEWEAYYDLRYRILRKPLHQPLGSEKNEGDVTGIHFAYFEGGSIIAIARLDYQENQIAQIRFVAVESNLQAKGIGKTIMLELERRCIVDGKHKIILHARDYAVDFYLKLDYVLVEKSYKLFDVLQHFLMEKTINL